MKNEKRKKNINFIIILRNATSWHLCKVTTHIGLWVQSHDQSIKTSIAQSVREVLAKSKDVGSSPTRGNVISEDKLSSSPLNSAEMSPDVPSPSTSSNILVASPRSSKSPSPHTILEIPIYQTKAPNWTSWKHRPLRPPTTPISPRLHSKRLYRWINST